MLANEQTAQEEMDQESRNTDQVSLVTTKNELWKKLSWVVRETLANGGHEHGLSAGPVFGLLYMAQTTDNEPVDLGTFDGYDPYGYGEFGWGYGDAQQQYKDIQDILDQMTAAQQKLKDDNEARLAAAEQAMQNNHEDYC